MTVSYFVSNGVSSEQAASAIEYVCNGVPGYIMDETQFANHCTTNNVTMVSTGPSDVVGLVVPVLSNNQTRATEMNVTRVVPDPTTANNPHAQRGIVCQVSDLGVLKHLGREIVFHRPNDGYVTAVYRPINDGKFHIWLNGSSAVGDYQPVTYRNRTGFYIELLGDRQVRVLGCGDSWQSIPPSGSGIPLFATVNGSQMIVAELFKGNLFILVPFHISSCLAGETSEYQFLMKVYGQIIEHPFDDTERNAYSEIGKQLFTDFANAMLVRRRNQCESDIARARDGIVEHRRALTESMDMLRVATSQLEFLNSKSDERVAKLHAEYKLLDSLPFVERCVFCQDTITITTNVVTCVDERTNIEHELGRFRITIDMGNCEINFTNLTRRMGDHDAPHVSDDYVCEGNFGEMLPELFAAHEYTVLAQMAHRFLRSANVTDGWGKTIACWPLANRDDIPKYVEYYRNTLSIVGKLVVDNIDDDEYIHSNDPDGYELTWWKSSCSTDDELLPLNIAIRMVGGEHILTKPALDPITPTSCATTGAVQVETPEQDTWYADQTYGRRSDAIRAITRRGLSPDGFFVIECPDARWRISAR